MGGRGDLLYRPKNPHRFLKMRDRYKKSLASCISTRTVTNYKSKVDERNRTTKKMGSPPAT